ncbi:tRNA pseudouridine(55) synthase [hydrothermal vent metagenome]|uniref:tRNA pseudouridine(55) synthase n=1 Tax=hydrothermal vent metagenome TaxID=652676 RepID=A0A3B1C2L7_9ZZZZ
MITKTSTDLSNCDYTSGEVILIDKEKGKSSFNAVYRIRKVINVKKVGHAGTLDPAATGLLIVCVGKKTKEIYKYQDLGKTYSGIIELGKKTPSMDAETEVIKERSYDDITDEMIDEVRKSFIGEIQQIPPMYSALKHKGKALYKLARKGVEVKRNPRTVTIYEFEILNVDMPKIEFRIRCSKGTYIRVIADDFGEKLGCGGYLKALRRDAIGEYKVEDALTLDEFEKRNNFVTD